MHNLIKHKNLVLIIAVFAFISSFIVLNKYKGDTFSANSVNADTYDEVSIEPSSVELDIGEEYTFTSYIETVSGPMPEKSNWKVDNTDYVNDEKCDSLSKSCTIEAINGPAEVNVFAEINNVKAKATVNISSESSHESADEVEKKYKIRIEPTSQIVNIGESYTFTSYTETPTGPVETKSDYWELDSSKEVGEIKDCDGSSKCTFYADINTGNTTLFAIKGEDTANAYIEVVNEVINPFTDSLPTWADEYIISLYNKNIVSGYSDGRYGPSDSVTRAQYIVMLYRMAQFAGFDTENMLKDKDCNLYSDVKSDHYAYKAICFAKYYNWLGDAFNASEFKPEEAIIRELVAYINYNTALNTLYRNDMKNLYQIKDDYIFNIIYGYEIEFINEYYADYEFDDVGEYDKYATAIGLNNYYYIMNGSSSDNYKTYMFKPTETLNRAEAAKILWSLRWNINNS